VEGNDVVTQETQAPRQIVERGIGDQTQGSHGKTLTVPSMASNRGWRPKKGPRFEGKMRGPSDLPTRSVKGSKHGPRPSL
jgi:hypothetical protein